MLDLGIAGHVTGGGIGFLVRQLGLASDSLTAIELVTADGRVVKVDAQSNSDLFWALRGGGQGSFGIITKLQFRTHDVPRVHVYNYRAEVTKEQAVAFIPRWQNWIDAAPKEISSVIEVSKTAERLALEVKALTTGDERALIDGLEPALRELSPSARLDLAEKTFLQTFRWFSDDEYFPPTLEKGKSDVVKKEINDFYARIRPQMSSAAYLNYADCDIDRPAQAYWGVNLLRLIEVKQKYDPHNIFRHALSVPLELADVAAPVVGFQCR